MMDVTIERGELLTALAYFEDMTIERLVAEAQVYAKGVGMVIDCAGNSVELAARGSWDRVARAPASLFIGLAQRPPSGATVTMRVDGERFFLGTTSAPCTLQDMPETRIAMALDPSLGAVLATRLRFSHDVIVNAGLERAAANAASDASELIHEAAASLAPLGVPVGALRDFVFNYVREHG